VGSVQVGLTSGPGCDGAAQDYGYFLKLSNKVGTCPAAAHGVHLP
jgi:hypothetical protein